MSLESLALVNGTAIILCLNPVSYGAIPVMRASSLDMISGVLVKLGKKNLAIWAASIVRTRGPLTSPVIRPERGNIMVTCYPRMSGVNTAQVPKVLVKAIGMAMGTSMCHGVLICQAWWIVVSWAAMSIMRLMLMP